MPEPERGERRGGETRSIHVNIRQLDARNGSGKATAAPRRLALCPGERVKWTFAGFDARSYRPEIRFVDESPVGRVAANGDHVESDGCSGREGLHPYEVWLRPREGVEGSEIKLEIQPAKNKLGFPALKPDPMPPEIEVQPPTA